VLINSYYISQIHSAISANSTRSTTLTFKLKKDMSICASNTELDNVLSPADEIEGTILLVEYEIPGVGMSKNLKRRYRLQELLDILLKATNQGYCEGGSSGKEFMSMHCTVNNFDQAKQVIEHAFKSTKYGKYKRIVEENEAYWKELFGNRLPSEN
jgi:hypothetical protein